MRQSLQPICNRYRRRLHAPDCMNARVNPAHNDAKTFDRQLNSADGRSSAEIILFHFMTERRVK